jgi:hypothetical protein
MKVKDIRDNHHGYEIRIDLSCLQEEELDITLKEYNKKYGIPVWVYSDNLEKLSENRPCNHCKLEFGQTGVDPCYGYLEGVSGACCGHGNKHRQYINMANGQGWKLTLEEYKNLASNKSSDKE